MKRLLAAQGIERNTFSDRAPLHELYMLLGVDG